MSNTFQLLKNKRGFMLNSNVFPTKMFRICLCTLLVSVLCIFNSLLAQPKVLFQLGYDIEGTLEKDPKGFLASYSKDGNRVVVANSFTGQTGPPIPITYPAYYVAVGEYDGTKWVGVGNKLQGFPLEGVRITSISLSGDGSRFAFALSNGIIMIYEYDGSDWLQVGGSIDINSGGESDYTVSLTENGKLIAIGAPEDNSSAGLVQTYEENGGVWSPIGTQTILKGNNQDRFGSAVSLDKNGMRLAVGAPGGNNNDGYVSLYEFNIESNRWDQIGNNIEGDATKKGQSGTSVSLSSDGNRVAIGAPYNDISTSIKDVGLVRVYDIQGNSWSKIGADIIGSSLEGLSGYSVSLSSGGSRLLVGTPKGNNLSNVKTGYARLYEYAGGIWTNKYGRRLGEAAGDQYGSAVFLSDNGKRQAICAPYHQDNFGLVEVGQVRVFQEITLGIKDFKIPNESLKKPSWAVVNNQNINLAEYIENYGSTLFTIQAFPNSEEVRSVSFEITGAINHAHIENEAPFTLFGSHERGLIREELIPGEYTITATPYLEPGANGEPGEPLTIHFNVYGEGRRASKNLIESDEMTEGQVEVVNASPNPVVQEEITIHFSESLNSEVSYQVYDTKGSLMLEGNQKVLGEWMNINLQKGQMARSLYFLKLIGKEIKPTSIQFVKD